MYFWQSGEQSYKQISVAFFVLIFDRHLHKTFRTPDYFSHGKATLNDSVMSLAYVVIMVTQLCNWTF